MVADLLVGIILTIALVISLLFSGFILFVVISSQQGRTGTSLLLFQLGFINGILALLFLTLSTPSLLQGRWLTGFPYSPRSPIPSVQSGVQNATAVTALDTLAKPSEDIEESPTSPLPKTFASDSAKIQPTSTIEPVEMSSDVPITDYLDYDTDIFGDVSYLSTNDPPPVDNLVKVVESRKQNSEVRKTPSKLDVTFEFSVTTQVSVTALMAPVTTILVLENGTRPGDKSKGDSTKKGDDVGKIFPRVNMTSYGETMANIAGFQKPKHGDVFCRIYGWLLITLHVAAVWIIVGLQCDKFIAISSPLRYNTLLTRNRVAAYSIVIWVVAFVSSSLPLAIAEEYMFTGGACLPAWHIPGSFPITLILLAVMLFIPGCVIVAINIQIIIIARRHQHRIFSAIFEVMMSAQATVTHQRNPFEVPKKKQKSTRSVVEQLTAFAISYCPVFAVALWETFLRQRIDRKLELLGVSLFLVSPLINSFLYGIKCKSLRKSFKNYLRKRLYKSEVRSEIEARVPSGQNSRRPSITSSITMPFLQRTLKRRMSDYLTKDNGEEDGDGVIGGKMVRRSSDLSWHPLEDGTPSPGCFRKPLDVNFSGKGFSDEGSVSVSQYLTVPSFKTARSYQNLHSKEGSIGSIDSECLSEIVREAITEEEGLTTPDVSPLNARNKQRSQSIQTKSFLKEEIPLAETVSMKEFFVEDDSIKENLPRNKAYSLHSSRNTPDKRRGWQGPGSYTPLLISAYTKPINPRPVNTSSPYVAQTIDALMSIGLSQSLLKFSSLWRCKSKESLNDGSEALSSSSKYVAIPIQVVENENLDKNRHETSTFSYQVSANCSSKDFTRSESSENTREGGGLTDVTKDASDITYKCEDKLSVDKKLFSVNDINVNILKKDVNEVK